MKYILIYICIIFILFYIVNSIIYVNENFLTYFLPYYNVKSNLLRDFYVNNDNNKNFFKHKMIYDKFYFIGLNNHSTSIFLNNFSKRLISKSNIINSEIVLTNNSNDIINQTNNKNNVISMITIPEYLILNNDFSNIKLISNLYKIYLLIMTKLKYQINNIEDIKFDTTIGISKNNTAYYFYKKFFNDINKPLNEKNVKIYNTDKDLFNAFLNDEIQVIYFFKELPSKEINDLLNEDYNNQIIILPFQLTSKIENIFQKKNDFTETTYFDLNKVSQKYLPKKFGDHYYFVYRPNIKLLNLYKYLVCNKNVNTKIISQIFNFVLDYKNVYRNTEYQIPLIEPNYNLIKYIPYHPQVLKDFRNKGYISNIDSKNCKYFVGVKECTKQVLENNGMELE